MKCMCGNDKFYAKQVIYVDEGKDTSEKVSLDVVVDESNNWLENVDEDYDNIIEAEHPEGPYICTKCGSEYKNLI